MQRMSRQSFEDQMFSDIRRFSKFCSVCGKKLNMSWLEKYGEYKWHYPWCRKCRNKIFPMLQKEYFEDLKKDICKKCKKNFVEEGYDLCLDCLRKWRQSK